MTERPTESFIGLREGDQFAVPGDGGRRAYIQKFQIWASGAVEVWVFLDGYPSRTALGGLVPHQLEILDPATAIAKVTSGEWVRERANNCTCDKCGKQPARA